MKPNNEWDYLAEGNLHVVLKSNNDQHLGFVIRLTKFAPQRTSTLVDLITQGLENFVPEKLAKYIPAAQTLTWPQEKIAQIAASIEQSRPLKRRVRQIDPTQTIVMTENLFEDYSKLFPHQQTFSIEIKPKSFLPLFCQNAINQPKFFLIQLKKAQEKLEKSGKSFKTASKAEVSELVSQYNPELLFSADQEKISQSITQLLDNLENNLKLFYKGEFETDSLKFLQQIGLQKQEFADLVASLLKNEDLLSEVSKIQLQNKNMVEDVQQSLEFILNTSSQKDATSIVKQIQQILDNKQEASEDVFEQHLLKVVKFLLMITWCDISIVINVIIANENNFQELAQFSTQNQLKRFRQLKRGDANVFYRLSIVDYQLKEVTKINEYHHQAKELLALYAEYLLKQK